MSEPAIGTRALTHRFGRLTALDQVDLTVETGQIYGFLGRNGAGKTTLIRAVLGLIAPTAGEVTVLGHRVRSGHTPPSVWARIGYLVEGPGLYPQLTVVEHLRLAAGYRRLPASAVGAAMDRLDLGRYAAMPARALSMGNRQRLGLALALLHRPPLLVLDEPVNGLDPAGVVDIREMLRSLSGEGVTVFMSTHLISEVARLADRVGIIHAGRLLEELSRDRLDAAAGERFVARFPAPEQARAGVAALSAVGVGASADGCALVSTSPEAIAQPDRIATRLVTSGAAPTYLAVEHEDLEEYFLRLTGGVS